MIYLLKTHKHLLNKVMNKDKDKIQGQTDQLSKLF